MRVLRRFAVTALSVALTGALLTTTTPATADAAPAATVAVTPPPVRLVPGTLRLDRRCLTGHILCVNKRTRKVVFMADGKPQQVMDARFGCAATPTRDGHWLIFRKSRHQVSTLYRTPMPWAMFFSGGQAVHYSPDFAARGYRGCSHGCVNVRDRAKIAWTFDRIRVGDSVLVYWG